MITVLDTAEGMAAVLAAPEQHRPDVLRRMLAPVAGMYRYVPGEPDPVAMHAMGFGFPLDRRIDESREALAQLVVR